jgi:hypothetical protein
MISPGSEAITDTKPYSKEKVSIRDFSAPIRRKKAIIAPSRTPHPASDTGSRVSKMTGGTMTR